MKLTLPCKYAVKLETCREFAHHSRCPEPGSVEEAYELWHERIAIMGGIDMDLP